MNLLDYLKLCEKNQHGYFHTSTHPPYSADNFGIRNTRPLINLQDKINITDELNTLLSKYLQENLEQEMMEKRCEYFKEKLRKAFEK